MTNQDYVATTSNRTDTIRPEVSIGAPIDRVRWSSVLAGLFTVLATMIVLAVLGIAVGLSTLDADNPRGLAIGASLYGAISALIAFAFGGFISARTAAVVGPGNAILNGLMVWIVTIPLIVNVLGAGIGTLLGTAVNVGATAAVVGAGAAASVADDIASDPQLQAEATQVVNEAGEVVEDAQQQLENVTPADVEEAAEDLSPVAWSTLLALGLSAAAAIGGGLLGTRTYPTDVAIEKRRYP